MPQRRRVLPTLAAGLLLAGAATEAHAGLAPNWEESGQASWYGARFAGRRTSGGDTFSPAALTAAHDSLPLGARIRVTTQSTGQSVVVTVTDRMPTNRVRIIDLSRAAAARIGLLGRGVDFVTLTEAKAADAVPEEVAEDPAPDRLNPPPRGRPHTPRAARTASAHHAYYPARSAAPAPR